MNCALLFSIMSAIYCQQPDFWLEIRKEYIIENFEKLVYYIKRYQYSGYDSAGSEFSTTCKHLVRLAEELSEYSLSSSFINKPEFRLSGSDMVVPEDLAFRIMVAAILASQKIGNIKHKILLRLANLLVIKHKMPRTDISDELIYLVCNCMRKSRVSTLGLKWDDIENPENFSATRLLYNICQTRFNDDSGCDCGFEGKGTVMFTKDGVKAAPLNRVDYLRTSLTEYLSIGKSLKVYLPKSDHIKKPDSVEDVADGMTFMTRAQSGVKNQQVEKKRKYVAGAIIPVAVRSCWGVKIQAESIDPGYEKVAGKVNINLLDSLRYVDKHKMMTNVREGITLFVEYTPDDNEFMFSLKGGFNPFYEEFANQLRGEHMPGVYIGDYSAGTQWLTEDGFVVNVMGDVTDEDVLMAMEQHIPVNIRMNSTKSHNGNVLINGGIVDVLDVDNKLPEPVADIDSYEYDAFSYLFGEFLKYSDDNRPALSDEELLEVVDEEGVIAVGNVLVEHQRRLTDTMPRLACLQTALMLNICSGNYDMGAYTRHELEYQMAVARFAAGASPMSLTLVHGQNLDGIPEVEKHERILAMIRNYREPEIGHVSDSDNTEENLEDTVDGLIDASNRLLGKIDDREISRIKLELARVLDVDDQFKIADQVSYYGVESDTLEFKSSAVCPPKNRLKGSQEYEPDTQIWAVLKTVCGFLNSTGGGELLLGVRDNGVAIGIDHDYNLLFENGRIPEANADRYRTYLKNIIDNSFIAYKSRLEKSSVTTAYISYTIEVNNEGIEILRIRVDSFRGDMVRFHPDCNRPEEVHEAYIRTSGATVPMNRTVREQTMQKKYHKVGDRDGNGMAAIYEARNSKKRVLLKSYTSRSGVRDREVEVFQVFAESNCILAYDVQAKDVRLFKCSRWMDAVILDKNCTQGNSSKRDLQPDVFGFVFDPDKHTYKVELELTEYGAMLLREEHPGAVSALFRTGRTDFPWLFTISVNSLDGVGRFVRGLPSECRYDDNSDLAAFLES